MADTVRIDGNSPTEFGAIRPPNEWAERCEFWRTKSETRSKRKRRERRTEPLVLNGHGMSLRVDKSCLIIRGGNTHFPSPTEDWRFFRGSLDVPLRIVAVDGSGTVSLDALDWMAEQGIAFVRINYDGSQAMVMSPTGYAAFPERIGWQRETRDDPKRQLAFAVDKTKDKLKAALDTLRDGIPHSTIQFAAIQSTQKALVELETGKPKSLSELLGIEGPTAKAYWRAWQGLEIRWKAQSRYPVPDEWRAYTSRISQNDKKWRNRNATHPINAMLNYAYAALLTEMRIKAIADGYDPMLGILHDQRDKGKDRTPSFALDLMEPMRPVVDRAVLKLIADETFSGADFQLQADGVCRLNPQLAQLVTSATIERLTHHA